MTPEHTDVDEYTCPEPGCEFVIGAAGPVADDEPDEFAEEVRAHQARHFAERADDITADNDSTLATNPTVPLTHAAVAVAAATVLGLASGLLAAGEPVVQTPQVCHVMAAAAEALDDVQAALTEAVNERGDTLGKDDYRVKDAEVNHLLASMGPAETAYNEAEAACLGVDR